MNFLKLFRQPEPANEEEQRGEAQPILPKETEHEQRRAWLFAWPMLVAAVLAVSSAATAFKLMGDVPPLTLAAWRLQLTTLLLAVGAVWQWRNMVPENQAHTLHKWKWLLASGVCLAVHFGAWVWSLQETSLTHSLVLVSTSPVILALGALAMRQPVGYLELGGAILAVAGGIVLGIGTATGEDKQASAAGDLAALVAAFAFVGYISVGAKLRSWMPIFVYATPVTGVAAVLLTVCGMAFERSRPFRSGKHGVFGWLGSGQYAPYVVYLAVVPGIVGHTGFNTLLRWMPPLIITLAVQFEPVIGSFIGWVFKVMGEPGPLTYVGGVVILISTTLAAAGSSRRQFRDQARRAASVALTRVFFQYNTVSMPSDADDPFSDHDESPRGGPSRPQSP